MKKTFFLLSLFVYFLGISFAQQIELTSNISESDINQAITLSLRISDIENPGQVTISGMQNFQVLGQANSSNIQIVNGKQSIQTYLQLQIQAKQAGIYSIGPAIVQHNGNMLQSNQITLTITGNKLFVNPQQQAQQQGNNQVVGAIQETPIKADTQGRRFIAFTCLALLLLVFFRKKLQQLWQTRKKETSKQISIPSASKIYTQSFPELSDSNFREQAEQWVREQLTTKTGKNLFSTQYKELHAICSIFGTQQAQAQELLNLIIQARYAGADDREQAQRLYRDLTAQYVGN